jgi:hypothetical protein
MPDPETSDDYPQQDSEVETGGEEPDCSSFPPRDDCDPDVNDLECVAAGDKAKADYSATFATDLKTAKATYDTTRTAYRTARHDVWLTVEDLRHQIRHLVERIACQIEQPRIRRYLDEAFYEVLEELKCCPTPDPCCTDGCDFELDDIEYLSSAELAERIARYQKRTDEAKASFTTLTGEPQDLRDRVAARTADVARITAALGGDAAALDLKQTYADALVTKWKISRVWQGFGQVQDFVDCLCGALTCWTRGCEAVYVLTGAKAVVDCKDDAKAAYCTKLWTETVQQILARYDRRCARRDGDETSSGNGGSGGHGHGNGGHEHGNGGHEPGYEKGNGGHEHGDGGYEKGNGDHDHHHDHDHDHHRHHDCGCGR